MVIKHRLGAFVSSMLLVLLSHGVAAQPNMNDMQGCQALLAFMDSKLEVTPPSYQAEQVTKVRSGLQGYYQFIQTSVMDPGLQAYSRGDAKKAEQLQSQIEMFMLKMIEGYQKRFPGDKIKMDQLMALDACTKKAPPQGENLSKLKQAFEIMVAWARQ